MVPDHHPGVGGLHRLDDLLALRHRPGDRLLGENRLAVAEQLWDQRAVAREGLRGDKAVEILAGQHLLVRGVDLRHPPPRRDLPRQIRLTSASATTSHSGIMA